MIAPRTLATESCKASLCKAAELIAQADVVALFAGAGMGVDSGLSQFRGDDGLWNKSIVIDGVSVNYSELMTHKAFVQNPHSAWGLIAGDPLPVCPNCGLTARPNVLLFDDWNWVSTKSADQQEKYIAWKRQTKTKHKKIVVLEIGAGKTISTIRQAAQNMAGNDYPLVRINPYDCDVTHNNHIAIPLGAKTAITEIYNRIEQTD